METNLRNAADAIREYAHAKPIPERMLVIIKNIAEGILQLGTTCWKQILFKIIACTEFTSVV